MEADQRRGAPRGRRGAPRVWLPPAKFRNGIWGVGQVVVPYGWLRRTAAIARGSGAQRSVCGNGCEGWVGIAAEITPKVPINPGQSLSHGLRPCQLPLHKGAFPCGGRGIGRGADCRVGPAGLLAMTTVFCHSETSAHTGRGNPSFLRWTGVRAAVPRAWPPPTKFRAEIWGVGQVVVSYGTAGDAPQCRGHSSAVRWG